MDVFSAVALVAVGGGLTIGRRQQRQQLLEQAGQGEVPEVGLRHPAAGEGVDGGREGEAVEVGMETLVRELMANVFCHEMEGGD